MNLNLTRRPSRAHHRGSIPELDEGSNRNDSSPETRGARQDRTTRLNQLGWSIGIATEPHAGPLWCPWDRTCGVIGPQGSGKTLDLLTPALLAAPGAALVTLTKTDDLLLTITARSTHHRPCVVLDPFGQADGLPELIWDPIAGCVDPITAERRAKAFTAGTIRSAASGGSGDAAARFYAAEAAKVLQCYLHAAALVGHHLDQVLRWVANPHGTAEPADILREHPHAAGHWHGLLQGAIHGDDRTAANTITTVQQAMALFFQPAIRDRCTPSAGRPATDIAQVIAERGTFYLLGREDPYASASPLMTALAEHILDTALRQANISPWGRLCPPMLACLDELPSTAPLPTLRTRMANERALGISIIYAAQTWRQLAALFGDTEARAIFGLTNVLALFGGSKDIGFNREVSDLVGTTRVARTNWQLGGHGGRTASGEDIPILRPEEIRQLPDRHALVIAENTPPILARLHRCIDGKAGRVLLDDQRRVREHLTEQRQQLPSESARAAAALAAARRHSLLDERGE
jgi:type IV secretion system protein VirD4